jgi:hypothetical protein
MISGKFVNLLTKAHRQIFFEQDVPVPPPADPAGAPPMDPSLMPPPPMPAVIDKATKVEEPKQEEGPITQENESFLIDLIAKSIFIELDDEEKYKVKNMQQNLTKDTANDIELQLLKRIKGDSYKILDIEENIFELTPDESRSFLNKLIGSDIIKNLEVGQGDGEMYLTNLLITSLLRDFSLDDKVKVETMLKNTKDDKKNDLKTESLLKQAFEKYAKI